MPELRNKKWERVAQGLAKGMSQVEAGKAAGYSGASGNMSTICGRQPIRDRVLELQLENRTFQEGLLAARAAALKAPADDTPPEVTLDWLLAECFNNLRIAQAGSDIKAANDTIKLIAQLKELTPSGRGGDRRPRQIIPGGEYDVPNGRTQVAVQVFNSLPPGVGSKDEDRIGAGPHATAISHRPVIPAVGDDRAFVTASLLDGVACEELGEISGTAPAASEK